MLGPNPPVAKLVVEWHVSQPSPLGIGRCAGGPTGGSTSAGGAMPRKLLPVAWQFAQPLVIPLWPVVLIWAYVDVPARRAEGRR